MKTRVYITVDVECAEERGETAPVLGWNARVWGRFPNQPRALGVELIMDELERHDLRGTFFTEALGSAYFGERELAAVCGAMVARGHDVQLHTHPRQIVANWRSLGAAPASDDIGAYGLDEQVHMLRQGVAILERCGVPAGTVRAFRAGNFGASNATWEAMARAGMTLSSNYNPCYFAKNCKLRADGAASAGLFRVPGVPHVYELPITNFVESGGGFRHAQITAISRYEARSLLDAAHAAGLREVTIVTHSFELYHLDTPTRGRPNTVNVLRLRDLARYLADHRDRFEVETVGALAQRLAEGSEPIPAIPREHPRGQSHLRLARLASQAYKRIEQRLPWSLPVV